RPPRAGPREPQLNGARATRRDGEIVVRRGLRAAVARAVDSRDLAVHEILVDAVFHERTRVGCAEEKLRVRLVVGKEELRSARAAEIARPELAMVRGDQLPACITVDQSLEHGTRHMRIAPPGIAKPELWHEMQSRRLGCAILRRDADQDFLGGLLGIFDEDVEVAILIEYARVQELVLELEPAALAIAENELAIREGALRILVQHAHVGV